MRCKYYPFEERSGGDTHDNRYVRMKILHRESYARDQTAASDRDDHSIYVGNLLHDLEAQRPLPRYNVRIIVSMNTEISGKEKKLVEK